MALYDDLLKGAFGYRPKNLPPPEPAPAPVAPEPEKRTYNTRDSVVRDNPIGTTSAVQALVWGNSNPGGAGMPEPAGPPPAGISQGLTKPQGWGATSG